ncbi:zinc-binding dehydrogenase [Pedobacter gandavensis]|uniref:alcohol dehydrogenase n=1 Tax=Pedobacter gandavensis TaxID=2679963 RepID=A0ABR6ER30_9SPHI|nr:zinc-binding dehydrogenase [Pedobacter gandavensis]MBB2147492.1 zinc-binding dehydrogenase [Pedobacter gandavensis]
MKTGQLLVFDGADKPLRLVQMVVPTLKNGEILIKNVYTTLCGSDLHTYCGKRNEKTPTVLGHEIIGTVDEIANGHSHQDFNGEELNIGDRVTWAVFAAEPQEEWLSKKMPQKSENLFKYGHARIDAEDIFHGGLGDFTILKPHTAVFKLPEKLPTAIAATINCAVATVAGAMRLAGEVSSKTILVTGMGLLGNLAVAMCKVQGAKEIIAIDISEERLAQSKRFGATHTYLSTENDTIQENLSGYQIDVAFEMSGAANAAELGVEVLTVGGIAVWIGAVFKTRKVEIDAEQIIRKMITIKGLHNYNFEDLQYALEFMGDHHQDFPFHEIIAKEFPLTEATEAFEYALAHKPLRVGVYIDQPK